MNESESMLIVAPSWVGDIIMSQTLYRRLKQLNPRVTIDVLAPPYAISLIKRMPEVSSVHPSPIQHGALHLGEILRSARFLRKNRYDQAIVVPRSYKSALVPFLARIPKRTGFTGEHRYGVINDRREPGPDKKNRMVDAYMRLVDGAPVSQQDWPALRVNQATLPDLVARLNIPNASVRVGIMPGAEFGPSKMWGVEKYRECVRQLTASGVACLVFGGPKDTEAGDAIVKDLGSLAINLCGKTRLDEVVDLMSTLAVAITNDSGLMHVAASVSVPVLVMYGGTSPDYTPPLSSKAVIHYQNISCSPCFERQCRYGTYECMASIPAASVMKQLSNLIDRAEIHAHPV